MSFQSYRDYKDSGVDWLGKVPKGWLICKVKHISSFFTGWTPPTGRSDFYVGENPWANISDLGLKILNETSKQISDSAIEDAQISMSKKGSLLFSFKLSIGQVSFAGVDMYTNEAIATFPTNDLVDLGYAYYAYPIFIVENASTNIYGAKLLNQELIRSARVALPTMEEQKSIASFLDHETSKIDAMVDEQKKLINLLNENRQAVISNAVTKGLNKTAKMKSTKVEWLGDIPEHWNVIPLKYFVSMKSGEQITSEQITEVGDFPVYGGNGLRGYFEKYTHDGEYCLIGRQGALCGNINYANGKFWASEHAVVVSPLNPTSTLYLGELLRSMNLGQYSTSAAQPGLSVEAIGNLRIPVASLEEQTSIAEYLKKEFTKWDTLTEAAFNSISLLQERRSALISAAVTGQIDVRNYKFKEAA